MPRYRDRRHAGQELAKHAEDLAGCGGLLLLALPRGGVPVAYELALALHLPMDLYVVRKLGVPGQAELAMGAIASGGIRVLNRDVIASLGISHAALEAVIAMERAELQRRESLYRRERGRLDLRMGLLDRGLCFFSHLASHAPCTYDASGRRT